MAAEEPYYPEFNSEDIIEAAAAAAYGKELAYSVKDGLETSDPEQNERSKRKAELIRELIILRSKERKDRDEAHMRTMKGRFKELIVILCRELFGKSRKYTEEEQREAKDIANQLTTPPERASKEDQLIARCRQAAIDILGRTHGREGYQAGILISIARSFPKIPRNQIASVVQAEIEKREKENNRPPSGRFERVTV